ncbi:MAG: orotidine-5'-phosphate decarboxylase [Gemmatimonadetes bacterium]|nr:orotidine-5'-phosphate decarboxylase [Gemmatimonadota bacterium]
MPQPRECVADVIVALDYPSAEEALAMVEQLGQPATFYKVGLELYTRGGPSVVESLAALGKRVFLDLKLHDIPNTVAGAVRSASELGVDLLTVHTAGGPAMLEAAAEASGPDMRILGVTLLTSLTSTDLEVVWGREIRSIREEVGRLTDLAVACELDGVVASALEVSWIRNRVEQDFLVVTPGIRPTGADRGDQRRVATPADAVSAGSDYLVVGRPVTQADDPVAALAALLAELGSDDS